MSYIRIRVHLIARNGLAELLSVAVDVVRVALNVVFMFKSM